MQTNRLAAGGFDLDGGDLVNRHRLGLLALGLDFDEALLAWLHLAAKRLLSLPGGVNVGNG